MNVACAWCGSSGVKTRYASVEWGNLKSTWYRCGRCSSLMILPRPSKKLLKQVYEDDYLNKRLQPHTGVDSRVRYAKEYRPTVYTEYEMSLSDLQIKKAGVKSILDFGCADGVFLEFCKKYFNPTTRLYGTDLSENMLQQARVNGWNVFSLPELDSISIKFDLITLWDVIEHIEDPMSVIIKLKKYLNKNGKIILQTPRFGHLGEQFGEHWPHLLPVQHLNIASKEGMLMFAKRAGLSAEKHLSFGANAPSSVMPDLYKRAYDRLAKKLDFGDVQIIRLRRRI